MQLHFFPLIVSFLLFLSTAGISQASLHFDHLTIEDGLSENRIECVFQDSKGFLWFGTEAGLNRYDGLEMKTYAFDPDQPELNYPKNIYRIIEEEDGMMWMRGLEAIYHYDPKKDSFEAFQIDKNKKGLYNILHELYLDERGHIWVGTLLHGLMRFEPDSNKFYAFASEFDLNLPAGFVSEIIEDSNKNLWFDYPNGLYKFSWADSSLSTYPFRENVERNIDDLMIGAVFVDSKHQLWAGTQDGLFRYDQKKDTFLLHPLDPSPPEHGHQINNVSESEDGKLWVSLFYGGLYIINTNSLDDVQYLDNLADSEDLACSCIQSINPDKQGNMWIGTLEKGVLQWSRNRKAFKVYPYEQLYSGTEYTENKSSQLDRVLGGIWVTENGDLEIFDPNQSQLFKDYNPLGGKVIKDGADRVWVGAWNHGLTRFDLSTKEMITYKANPDQPGSLPGSSPTQVLEDREGNIWVGVWLNGLYRYEPQKDLFVAYPMVDPKTRDTMVLAITSLYEDQHENLWLGDYTQLIKLRPDRSIDTIFNIPECFQFQEDHDGNLWMATGQGLCKLNVETGQYRFWREKDGLIHNRLYSIKADDQGAFWIGTHQGLSRFDPNQNNFRNFDAADGIPVGVFDKGASLKNKNGTLYFGHINGILRFHPDSIQDNLIFPRVVITELRIRNQSVPISGSEGDTLDFPSPLKHQIAYTEKVQLNYRQNDLYFEFRALSYFKPEKNKYRYRLKNYDQGWLDTDAQRPFASYTNLDPGRYILQVKGSNNDGIWNEALTELVIVISPPWWWNSWSKAGYLIAFLIGLWGIRKYEMRRQRLRYQLVLEQMKAKELEEVNELKSRFFTNISHEFRTPLTLILGPLQELIDRRPRAMLSSLQLIQRNGQRLLNLINQILDLSKLEDKGMKLQAAEEDLISFLKLIFSLFNSSAESKNIHYTFHCNQPTVLTYFDREKLEKVLINLLGNAFKFTPEGGKVQLSLQKLDEKVVITVSDSGPGIPPDQLAHVFDRFFQVDSVATRSFEGSGVGLALVKELIELHHGTIRVENNVEGGASFFLELPLGRDFLREGEVMEPSTPVTMGTTIIGNLPKQESSHPGAIFSDKSLPTVLVVDDNADMRAYIRQSLAYHFQLSEAASGQQGINFALKEIPDLIICDVMMPGVDGLEVCQTLKTDERTSHIPIILLTAKAGREARIEGLTSGADAYLAKPFYKEELLVRMRKLIELRQKLQLRYQDGNFLENSLGSNLQGEDAFLDKLRRLIEENLNDTEFGTPQLCRALGMSRSQLYRKVKALTNESVGHFMLLVRLHKARELLKTTSLNVSEVAYEVGFKDPAYFNRTFKKEFGVNPSETR